MKVEIMRQSGMPVDNLDAYKEEWKEIFDHYDNLYVNNKLKMEEVQKILNEKDAELKKNYTVSKKIKLPTSGKQWAELQQAVLEPILLATRADNKKLILIIMDEGL